MVYFIMVFIKCHVTEWKWFGDHDSPLYLVKHFFSWQNDNGKLFKDLKNNCCIELI